VAHSDLIGADSLVLSLRPPRATAYKPFPIMEIIIGRRGDPILWNFRNDQLCRM